MTVETTSTYAGPYTTDGAAVAFPFTFKALSAGEVRVEIGGVAVDPSLYGVTLAAQGGSITFYAPPAAGGSLYVISDPTFKQGIAFSNQSAFLPNSHNEANDRAAIRDQVLANGVARAIQLPLGEEAPELPPAPTRAGAALVFDANGRPATLPVGSFPAGPPGGSDSAFESLAALKASSPIDHPLPRLNTPAGVVNYAYVSGDFTGRADDVIVVKLDTVPLSTGALVQQAAASISFRQDGTGSRARSAQAKASDIINARDFGVKADGSDDLAALQAAVNAASDYGRPLQLPFGTIGHSGFLDLRGRAVDMRGVPNRTTIKALSAAPYLINAEEADDTYYTPFNIQDVYLDGDNKVTNANLSVRYRHGYDLSNIWSYNGFRGFRERDCYLSRHWNLRTGTCQIAYHIEGSNHSSLYAGCSAIGAAASGILIEAFGAVADGNHALLFQNCDVEFGDGDGVIIGAGTSARFDGCYLGEAIGQSVIRNLGGTVEINGGVSFWGYTSGSALCRPAGGRTVFRGTRLAAQDYGGIANLTYLSDAELAGSYGKVRFQEVDGYLPVGGNPILKGDPLDFGPQYRNYAHRTGRAYTTELNNVTITPSFPSSNAVRATVASVTGSNPTIGFYSQLIASDWRVSEPFYLVLVYKASKPVSVKISEAALGTTIFAIGTAPASMTTATYVKLDALSPGIADGVLELQMGDVVVGDFLEVIEVYFTDSTMHKQSVGPLGALYKC